METVLEISKGELSVGAMSVSRLCAWGFGEASISLAFFRTGEWPPGPRLSSSGWRFRDVDDINAGDIEMGSTLGDRYGAVTVSGNVMAGDSGDEVRLESRNVAVGQKSLCGQGLAGNVDCVYGSCVNGSKGHDGGESSMEKS